MCGVMCGVCMTSRVSCPMSVNYDEVRCHVRCLYDG